MDSVGGRKSPESESSGHGKASFRLATREGAEPVAPACLHISKAAKSLRSEQTPTSPEAKLDAMDGGDALSLAAYAQVSDARGRSFEVHILFAQRHWIAAIGLLFEAGGLLFYRPQSRFITRRPVLEDF